MRTGIAAFAAAVMAVAAALSQGAGTAAAQDPVVLRLHHFLSTTSSAHARMMQPWAERVEKASGGRLHIEIYPNMTLGGRPPQLIRQVRDGVADIVWTLLGYTPGQFPRTEVFELPFVHTNNAVATNLAMRELFDTHLRADFADVHVILLHVHAGNGIHMVDTAVRKVSDLEGRRIRVPSRTGAWTVEALGAHPVGMPVPDLPQALAKKVVDGALIPWEIIPTLKIHELTRYQIEGADHVRLGTATFVLAMNKARYEALPPDLKQAIDDNSGEDFARQAGIEWTRSERDGIALARAAGNEVITLGPDQVAVLRQRLEVVVERWIGETEGHGIDGRSLVEAARAAIARHGEESGNPWTDAR